jgi:hypothetical protein
VRLDFYGNVTLGVAQVLLQGLPGRWSRYTSTCWVARPGWGLLQLAPQLRSAAAALDLPNHVAPEL